MTSLMALQRAFERSAGHLRQSSKRKARQLRSSHLIERLLTTIAWTLNMRLPQSSAELSAIRRLEL
jgi:hypothetical protein